jgi:hypothetical protein
MIGKENSMPFQWISKIIVVKLSRCGLEQLISNSVRTQLSFAKRNKRQQAMIDLRGISTNWFQNQFCPLSAF